jgi:hypothetical protein
LLLRFPSPIGTSEPNPSRHIQKVRLSKAGNFRAFSGHSSRYSSFIDKGGFYRKTGC